MNHVLKDVSNTECSMDNILIYAKTEKELNSATETVIGKLNEAGLKLNKEKCVFAKQKINFLGHIFTSKGLEIDPQKTLAINNLKTPENKIQLRRLLGMDLNKFIPNLSKITEPLRTLIKKDVTWYWDIDQSQAFEKIKSLLVKPPVLRYYDVTKAVTLSVDASSKSLGAVLMQEDQPIAYGTSALTPTQQNYPLIEKEALAVKYACKKFHEYVYGKELTIETDHKPLESIFRKPIQNAPPDCRE
uniref:RNA-directed DNA polymerase n=1 Tax=Photinus pyralis TaxID=7054 RepID=A0A1Y1K3D2_PHOPY